MDEGGRKQVKFILKDGLIHIVGNHGLPNNNIEGIVEGPEGYHLSVSINGAPYKEITDKIIIPSDVLKKTSLQITVRGIKDKEVIYFKSDVIPLTQAIIFGKTLEESYPEVIKFLLKELNEVRAYVGLTKLELNKNMLNLVDTFEEINRKGSLF